MTKEQATNKRPIKQGLWSFSLTFIIVSALMTTQILLKYSDELFHKQLESIIILKFISYSFFSTIYFSLPVSVLVTASVYYRQVFQQEQRKIDLKSGLLPSSILTIACFLWLAIISPIIQLHMLGLLYDIEQKRPEELLKRTSIELFKNQPSTSDYFQIGNTIDSLKTSASNKNEDAQFRLYCARQITRLQIEKGKMIGIPILTFIFLYSGMFLGILNRHFNLLVLLICIYLTTIPGIGYILIYFEKLERQSKITPLQGQIFYLTIFTTLTVALFLYAKHHIRPKQTTAGNSA